MSKAKFIEIKKYSTNGKQTILKTEFNKWNIRFCAVNNSFGGVILRRSKNNKMNVKVYDNSILFHNRLMNIAKNKNIMVCK